ncbi:hypothetical protein BKA69DRAFT_827474 [Paraphysoderma sedebokerense]|nr:hypothetical protein BKA69DRAFT_827474 [Paraphysoderma sedebokerense]
MLAGWLVQALSDIPFEPIPPSTILKESASAGPYQPDRKQNLRKPINQGSSGASKRKSSDTNEQNSHKRIKKNLCVEENDVPNIVGKSKSHKGLDGRKKSKVQTFTFLSKNSSTEAEISAQAASIIVKTDGTVISNRKDSMSRSDPTPGIPRPNEPRRIDDSLTAIKRSSTDSKKIALKNIVHEKPSIMGFNSENLNSHRGPSNPPISNAVVNLSRNSVPDENSTLSTIKNNPQIGNDGSTSVNPSYSKASIPTFDSIEFDLDDDLSFLDELDGPEGLDTAMSKSPDNVNQFENDEDREHGVNEVRSAFQRGYASLSKATVSQHHGGHSTSQLKTANASSFNKLGNNHNITDGTDEFPSRQRSLITPASSKTTNPIIARPDPQSTSFPKRSSSIGTTRISTSEDSFNLSNSFLSQPSPASQCQSTNNAGSTTIGKTSRNPTATTQKQRSQSSKLSTSVKQSTLSFQHSASKESRQQIQSSSKNPQLGKDATNGNRNPSLAACPICNMTFSSDFTNKQVNDHVDLCLNDASGLLDDL